MSSHLTSDRLRSMNKDQMIRKIHLFGKIGQILSVIAMALEIFALLACMISIIVITFLPEDFVKITYQSNMDASLNLSTVSNQKFDKEINQTLDDIQSDKLSIKINNYQIESGTFVLGVLSIKGKYVDQVIYGKNRFYLLFLALILNLAIFLVTTWLIFQFSKKLKNMETPFDPALSTNLRWIALSLVPWYFLNIIGNTIYDYFLTGQFDVMFNLDVKLLVVIVFLLLTSLIFRYGALLQEESDETV